VNRAYSTQTIKKVWLIAFYTLQGLGNIIRGLSYLCFMSFPSYGFGSFFEARRMGSGFGNYELGSLHFGLWSFGDISVPHRYYCAPNILGNCGSKYGIYVLSGESEIWSARNAGS